MGQLEDRYISLLVDFEQKGVMRLVSSYTEEALCESFFRVYHLMMEKFSLIFLNLVAKLRTEYYTNELS